jgi:hypothetical protein
MDLIAGNLNRRLPGNDSEHVLRCVLPELRDGDNAFRGMLHVMVPHRTDDFSSAFRRVIDQATYRLMVIRRRNQPIIKIRIHDFSGHP